MWLLIIGFVVGIIFGLVLYKILDSSKKTVGVLRVDRSDPYDGPYLFLELKSDPSLIEKRSSVYLKVDASNYISQK